MKYLVLECHPGYAVVLSEDGRFLKAANLRYEVGQTVSSIIEVSLPQSQQQPVKTNNRRWVSNLAAMAACLVLMVTSFFYGQLPYASVYMTINPEVRIDVNRSDRVLDVEGMNTDGEQLLTGYDPGRKELDAVMDELVDRAIDMGYLHEGGRIILSLDGSEAWVSSHSSHLNDHLKEHLEETITVTIDVQQKQPETATPVTPTAPAVPTAPAGPIVIPVIPDGYDDSDYGEEESDYHADSDYEEAGGDSAYDTASDYGASDYADSDYGASEKDSDYDDAYEAESDYGASDYAAPAPVPEASDYGESDYVAPEPAPAASDYGDSGYDDPASDYAGDGGSNDDQSDYEESDYDD